MSNIRRPRVKVQANLGIKRKSAAPAIVKDEEDSEKDDSAFKCPLSTITPSNINNNNDIPSNNILQKDLQSSNLNDVPAPTTPPKRRRTSSSSSTTEELTDLKPITLCKTNSDLHLNIPHRVRTESSSSSHSFREPRIRTESGSSRVRTESVSSNYSEPHGPSRKSKMIRDVSNKDRSELTMFDLIYNYSPTANPMVKSEPGAMRLPPPPIKTETIQPPAEETNETPILVPQLKIGLNGEVIIDEQSLEIQTTAEKEAKKVLSNTTCIFMDEFTGSNGFYKKQKRTKEWPEAETIKFYKCLHTVGTDFTLMLTLFPNRSRRDLKLKFKREEKVNENLIKKALLYPRAFDIMELEKVLAKDEEDKRRREEEWNEIKKKRATSRRSKVKRSRKRCREGIQLSEGEKAYKNEGVFAENIKRIKVEKNCLEVLDDVIDDFVPEEEETQSSLLDASFVKNEYPREVTGLKQEAALENNHRSEVTELKEGEELLGEFIPDEDLPQNGATNHTKSDELQNISKADDPKIEEIEIEEMEVEKTLTDYGYNLEEEREFESPDYEDENDEEFYGDAEAETSRDMTEEENEHLNDQDDMIDDMTPEEIFARVENGSLAVVTSESDSGETVYEVYKMSPISGELSERPLRVDPNIINVIKSIV